MVRTSTHIQGPSSGGACSGRARSQAARGAPVCEGPRPRGLAGRAGAGASTALCGFQVFSGIGVGLGFIEFWRFQG